MHWSLSLSSCMLRFLVCLLSAFKCKVISFQIQSHQFLPCKSAWISGMSSSKKLKSSRGYCRYCQTIVWLDNMKCSNEHIGLNSESQKIDPVLPSQVFSILFCWFWFSDYSYLMGLSQSAVLLFNANNGSVKLDSEVMWCDWSILWHYIKDNRDCSSVCCCLAGSFICQN